MYEQRIHFINCHTVHEVLHFSQPAYLCSMLAPNINSYCARSTDIISCCAPSLNSVGLMGWSKALEFAAVLISFCGSVLRYHSGVNLRPLKRTYLYQLDRHACSTFVRHLKCTIFSVLIHTYILVCFNLLTHHSLAFWLL